MHTAIRPRPVRAARRRWPRLAVVALLAGIGSVVGPADLATGQDGPSTTQDPALDQTIDADEPLATGPATIAAGHVDVGPRFVDDRWTLLVHDDTADPPVWRSLDETVLHVRDTAIRTVPDDPAYSFLGVPAGTDVHVVPQTENPEVAWVGWNTQDPGVLTAVDRGVTLTLHGVHGPGDLTLYLQSGNFGEPEVLWRSVDPEPQPLWVDVNTHTHANWVFSAPGTYLVRVEASADLIDGEQVTDTRVLRFAVGDATDVEVARTATFSAGPGAGSDDTVTEDATADGHGADDGDAASGDTDDSGSTTPVVAGLAGLALLLVVGVAIAVVRGRGAKAQAERERAAASSGGDG
jgi:putative ABC transporter-associated repeat protein